MASAPCPEKHAAPPPLGGCDGAERGGSSGVEPQGRDCAPCSLLSCFGGRQPCGFCCACSSKLGMDVMHSIWRVILPAQTHVNPPRAAHCCASAVSLLLALWRGSWHDCRQSLAPPVACLCEPGACLAGGRTCSCPSPAWQEQVLPRRPVPATPMKQPTAPPLRKAQRQAQAAALFISTVHHGRRPTMVVSFSPCIPLSPTMFLVVIRCTKLR